MTIAGCQPLYWELRPPLFIDLPSPASSAAHIYSNTVKLSHSQLGFARTGNLA